ncbi:helix-turn-helix domain-containing protein [Terrarubrum flagellatum]|uniref:TetR/AcrR family transcriptional regulator n=1 Tax=Terrirubrum flagellatum TaxID=2895980 RepID=UPI00314531E5
MKDDKDKLRADAQANRDRILDVARDAFVADPQTSLNAIAKAAGVGPGTFYRHFPSREALLAGVYHKEIRGLVDLAPALLDAHPPLLALGAWCDRFAQLGSMKHGVGDTLRAVVSDQDLRETFRLLTEAVRCLMAACENTSSIRRGANPEDVLVLLSSVLRIAPSAAGKRQAERIITLILRGLGADELSEEEAPSSQATHS